MAIAAQRSLIGCVTSVASYESLYTRFWKMGPVWDYARASRPHDNRGGETRPSKVIGAGPGLWLSRDVWWATQFAIVARGRESGEEMVRRGFRVLVVAVLLSLLATPLIQGISFADDAATPTTGQEGAEIPPVNPVDSTETVVPEPSETSPVDVETVAPTEPATARPSEETVIAADAVTGTPTPAVSPLPRRRRALSTLPTRPAATVDRMLPSSASSTPISQQAGMKL